MSDTSQAIDLQKYIFDKDVNTRIKENRDEMLGIIRADIKELHSDMKAIEAKIEADIRVLDSKVERNNEVLHSKIETGFKALEVSIKQGKTLNKWIFGMFVTIILGIGGLAAAVLL